MEADDILKTAAVWTQAGENVALATVLETWGSSPFPVGSRMVFTKSGKLAGSVSGGCIEAVVMDAGVQVFASGVPQVLHYGVTDKRAWEIGLACGGKLSIFVERVG
jgi:xanthine dehydrogenase accessory factor